MFRVFESYGLKLETKNVKSSYPLSIKDERKTRALCEQRGLLVFSKPLAIFLFISYAFPVSN